MSEDAAAVHSPASNATSKPTHNDNNHQSYSSLPSPPSSYSQSHSPTSDTACSVSLRPHNSRRELLLVPLVVPAVPAVPALVRPHSASLTSPVINPAPIVTRDTPRLALATAPSSQFDYAVPSPVGGGGGPTSASYVVPPRPKPGRKPATDEPASKRKAQNRESQRAFRARKAAKLTEMQTQVEIAEQRHRGEMGVKMIEMREKEMRIAQLESRVAQLEESEQRTVQEREFWKEKALQLEEYIANTVHTFNNTPDSADFVCTNCKTATSRTSQEPLAKPPDVNVYMPPVPLSLGPGRTSKTTKASHSHSHNISDDPSGLFTEREIDFTAQFTRKPRVDTRPSIAFLTEPSEDDDAKCGFCTDDSNCLCRAESALQNMAENNDHMSAPSRDWTTATPNDAPTNTKSGPGTCSDCMSNPKQRAWCQRVAQLKDSEAGYFSPSSTSRNSSVSSDRFEIMEPRRSYEAVPSPLNHPSNNKDSIGCSDAFRLFDGRIALDQESMDWSTLKPISPDTQRETLPSLEDMEATRKYSALELDTAGVIATLQHARVPLMPRKEDGKHAHLVITAESYRRSTQSPFV